MAAFSSPSSHRAVSISAVVTSGAMWLLVVAALCCTALPAVGGQDSVCGTRFSDPASSAVLAPVVLQGQVERLDPMTSSPNEPGHPHVLLGSGGALYQAGVKVRKVYKGKELMEEMDREALKGVMVEGVGEEEDRELCIGHVTPGQNYLFFLRPQSLSESESPESPASPLSVSSSSLSLSGGEGLEMENATLPSLAAPYFVSTALPLHMDMKMLRMVKKALCPGCASLPIIKHVKCKNCATPPVLKRPMSSKDRKNVRAGRRLALRCVAKGNPKPSYTWLKDRRVVHHSSEGSGGEKEGRPSSVFRSGPLTIRYTKQFSLLVVSQVRAEDAGTYTCLAANAMGEVAQSVEVKVKGQQTTTPRPTPSPTSSPSSHPDRDLCPDPPCEVTSPPPSPSPSPDSGEEDADPCSLNPCYNGGSCFRDGSHGSRTHCQCLPDYHGNKCQFRRRTVVPDKDVDYDSGYDDAGDEEDVSAGSPPLDVDDHPDVDPLTPSDNDNRSISINDLSAGVDLSNSENTTTTPTTTTTTTPSVIQQSANRNIDQSPRVPTSAAGRRISKKRSRKHGSSSSSNIRGSSSHSKASKTGAPKLQVTECADQSFCLNGGTCKVVLLLQRKFCECALGFGGRKCEQVL